MLDAFIIDRLKRDEQRRRDREREHVLELPLEDAVDIPPKEKEPDKDPEREPGSDNTNPTIIDYKITMPLNRWREGLYSSYSSR
ncbi:MAG TPA: hypothetical protein VJI15_01800 [Candidatus Nanoarchaeia archaeon]|nr:hypothetical protein [Candidatus Nanoarchaeia archaeon]